ncbi:MAG: MlaD family protein [Candidatus Latescibacterota bacterium]
MTLEIRNTLVGSCVVIVAALLLIYSSRSGVSEIDGGYQLKAIYQSVDGVSVGTDVMLTGIKVGEVTKLGYVPDGHRASLTMRIEGNIKLPSDSVAMIISSGMLGGKYIKLEPGGEIDNLGDGDHFEYVQDAIIFEELLEKIVLDAEAKRMEQMEKSAEDTIKPKNNPFGSLLK